MIKKLLYTSKIGWMIAILFTSIFAGCDDEKDYLIREDDSIAFTNAPSSLSKTIRSNTQWQVQIPNDASWITVSPMSGEGNGSFQTISISVDRNRSDIRNSTINVVTENGKQYPINVLQDDGKIVYSQPEIKKDLIESYESEATISLSYSKSVGDENVKISCQIEGEASEGLSITPFETMYDENNGNLELKIEGTPAKQGAVTFNIMVDGLKISSLTTKVLDKSTIPVGGLPAMWAFTEYTTNPSSDEKAAAKALLEAAQKETWMTGINGRHYLVPTEGNATLEIMESADKTASLVNGWACNDGHAYLKGLYLDDYFLFTIPVKNLKANTTLNLTGSIGGSGSSAGLFIIEYSSDNINWNAADGTQTNTFTINEKPVTATYHVEAKDDLKLPAQFSQNFAAPVDIMDGNLYVRLRVAANIRITKNNTITNGGGGSTRLKGIVKVSVVN